MKACGHFSKAGDWVQQYAGTNTTITPEGKDGWAQDVVAWTAQIAAESSKIGMLMIPNWGGIVGGATKWDSKIILGVGNGTDGSLDESGFTGFSGSSVKLGEEWENTVRFALNLQRSGKAYYSINQWGRGDAATPGKYPPTVPLSIPVAVHAWVLASFMLTNINASGTTLVCSQCYGVGKVNYSSWQEDAAKVGRPTAPPAKDPVSGIWSRTYEHALVFVNPGCAPAGGKCREKPPQTIIIPAVGGPWRELLGQAELLRKGDTEIMLNVSQAAVLVPTHRLISLKADDFVPVYPERMDHFPSGAPGKNPFRGISAMVSAGEGTFVAAIQRGVYSVSGTHLYSQLCSRVSTSGGASWSMEVALPPFTPGSINGSEMQMKGSSASQPVLIYDAHSDTVLLHFVYSAPHTKNKTVATYQISTTRPFTQWSTPRSLEAELAAGLPASVTAYPGPGHGIQIQRGPHAGRLLASGWLWDSAGKETSKSLQNVTCWYSDDSGQTWRPSGVSLPLDESQLAEISDGSILMYSRHGQDNSTWPIPCRCQAVSLSTDGGDSFGAVPWLPSVRFGGQTVSCDPRLPAPGAAGLESCVVRQNATTIAFANSAGLSGVVVLDRGRMTLRRSSDDGRSWDAGVVIERGPTSYCDLAAAANGTGVAVLWMARYHQYSKMPGLGNDFTIIKSLRSNYNPLKTDGGVRTPPTHSPPIKTTDSTALLPLPLQMRLQTLMGNLSNWLMRLNVGGDSLNCGVADNLDCRNQSNHEPSRTYPSTTIFGNANFARTLMATARRTGNDTLMEEGLRYCDTLSAQQTAITTNSRTAGGFWGVGYDAHGEPLIGEAGQVYLADTGSALQALTLCYQHQRQGASSHHRRLVYLAVLEKFVRFVVEGCRHAPPKHNVTWPGTRSFLTANGSDRGAIGCGYCLGHISTKPYVIATLTTGMAFFCELSLTAAESPYFAGLAARYCNWASDWLTRQVQPDGSIPYRMDGRVMGEYHGTERESLRLTTLSYTAEAVLESDFTIRNHSVSMQLRKKLQNAVGWLLSSQSPYGTWGGDIRQEQRSPRVLTLLQWYYLRVDASPAIQAAIVRHVEFALDHTEHYGIRNLLRTTGFSGLAFSECHSSIN